MTPHAPYLVAYGNFLFKQRNRIFPLVLLALAFAFAPAASSWVVYAGYATALGGQLLRASVIGFAYIKRGGLNKKVYADTLVTSGFFAACRNPLYVGNMLIFTGLLLIHGNPVVIALGLMFFASAYTAIIAAEETYLAAKFGAQYETYCASVPRWRIRVGVLASAIKGMRFDMRKVIYKDYSTCAIWHAQAVFLLAYRDYLESGAANAHWLMLLVAIGVGALAIRTAKKMRPLAVS